MNARRYLVLSAAWSVVLVALSPSAATADEPEAALNNSTELWGPCAAAKTVDDPCPHIESLELRCDLDRSWLTAAVGSDLPPCVRLRLVADDAFYRDAIIRWNGRAWVAWRNPVPGEHEVCIDECGICESVMCGCLDDAECDDGVFCNGEETCDVETGACVPGENPCAWYQDCEEERNACVNGYVRRTAGCSLNGVLLDQDHHEITVAPGEQIRGCVNVETTNLWPSNAVTPLGGTVDWGNREDIPWLAEAWIPRGTNTYAVDTPPDLFAPAEPGQYHVIIAFSAEFTIDQVMSLTNWPVPGNPVWHDGNDVGFDWTEEQFEQALHYGAVLVELLTSAGYVETWLPATAVVVHVTGPLEFTWDKLNTPYAIGAPSLAVYEGRLYGFGGYLTTGSSNNIYTDKVWSFDPTTGEWNDAYAVLPYPAGSATMPIVVGHTLFLSPQLGPTSNGGWGQHNSIIEYDFVKDIATETATYCAQSSIWNAVITAAPDGTVYSLGGWNGSAVNTIFRYNGPECLIELPGALRGDPWTPCRDADGRTISFGDSSDHLRVMIFDPDTETATYVGRIIPPEMEGSSICWLDPSGLIFLANGVNQTVFEFETLTETFTPAGFALPPPTANAYHRSHAYDAESRRLFLWEERWNGTEYETFLWIGTRN